MKQLETDKRIDTVFDALDRGTPASKRNPARRVTSYTTRDPKEIAKLLAVVP